MHLTQYIPLATRTEAPPPDFIVAAGPMWIARWRVTHAALGVCSEIYELQSAFTKLAVGEEHGDVWWYLAVCSDATGIKIDTDKMCKRSFGWSFSKMAEIAKKGLYYGKEFPREELEEALYGVATWSQREIYKHNLSLDDVLRANIDKLRHRHGDKFDPVGVEEQNRDREGEAKVLSAGLRHPQEVWPNNKPRQG